MLFIPENVSNDTTKNYDFNVWFIIGNPMWGKSTFANSFPSPILFNTDGNHKQFATPGVFINKDGMIVQTPEGPVTYMAWEYFKLSIDELVNNVATLSYKTLIIDLAEDLYEMCRQYIFAIHRKKHETEIGAFGAGYKLVQDEYMGVISKAVTLREHGWNILILSHQKIINVRTVDEKIIETMYGANIRSKIQDKIKGISQITGRVDKIMVSVQTKQGPVSKEEYILRVNEGNKSIAGNRLYLPFNEIYLSYEGWQAAVASISHGTQK